MKSYTDLEQSKKLAEILPLESADMHYNNASIKGINYVDEYRAELMDYNTAQKVLSKYLVNPMFEIIPCWSLAALLDILPIRIGSIRQKGSLRLRTDKCETDFNIWYVELDSGCVKEGLDIIKDNPVDACYEMILKLHELNLL